MSILVERVSYVYDAGAPTARTALRDVSLRIADGACAAIIGVTGSGKSTLVQHFNGLLHPTSGRVVVDGVEIGPRGAPAAALRDLRRRVALVFQFPEAQLFAPTVFEDVAFGPRQLGLENAEVGVRVRRALRAVALEPDDALLRRSPFALSGGQRRRIALAGALAVGPQTLVLDEPSAGLDAEARDELYEQLRELHARQGLTVVLVSHDMSEVARIADTLFVLAQGELRLSGPPEAVFRQTDAIQASGLLPPPLAQVSALAEQRGLARAPDALTPASLAAAIQPALAPDAPEPGPQANDTRERTRHAR